MRYWVNTVSRDHVLVGVAGGFTQADHGSRSRLERLAEGDWLVFYSPRTSLHAGEPLQAFTAIGRIADSTAYQVEMTESFHPWRRRVAFEPSASAPIRPLIGELSFIHDKRSWGYPFRRGLFEIDEQDFARIATAMGVSLHAFQGH